MDKTDLIDEFHEEMKKAGYVTRKDDSRAIFNMLFDVLSNRIKSGYTVSIREFGVFESHIRGFHNVNDPGNAIQRWVLKFKPSKLLKDAINEEIK